MISQFLKNGNTKFQGVEIYEKQVIIKIRELAKLRENLTNRITP